MSLTKRSNKSPPLPQQADQSWPPLPPVVLCASCVVVFCETVQDDRLQGRGCHFHLKSPHHYCLPQLVLCKHTDKIWHCKLRPPAVLKRHYHVYPYKNFLNLVYYQVIYWEFLSQYLYKCIHYVYSSIYYPANVASALYNTCKRED